MAQMADAVTGTDACAVAPPLGRWAASGAPREGPPGWDELRSTANGLPPRHRDAMVRGLLDAAGSLDEPQRRQLVRRGLRSGQGPARLAALEWLCGLGGVGAAGRRARPAHAAPGRNWRRPPPPPPRCSPPGWSAW